MSSDKNWREVQDSIRRIADEALRTSDRNYTDLDLIRANFTYLAEQVGKVVDRGEDRLYVAAVMLAEASADPERVHGELVFDPRPLNRDDVLDYDLPLGGEWHPRGEVPMSKTRLPVVVPESDDADDDGYEAQAVRDLARLQELAAAARTTWRQWARCWWWAMLTGSDPEPVEAEVATARDLEHRQRVASDTLDALCFHLHEDALPIAALAHHTKMSERDVYVRIDRHRGHLSA